MTGNEKIELILAYDAMLKAFFAAAVELVGNSNCGCLCLKCQLNSDVFLETYKGQGSKWMEVWMKITGRKPIKCKDDVEQLKLKFGEDDGTS